MPKVIKGGIFSSEKLLKEIPSGMKMECGFCFAEVETVASDSKEAKFTKKAKKIKGGKIFVLGWTLKCPECGKNIFFFCPNMTDKRFNKTNGW